MSRNLKRKPHLEELEARLVLSSDALATLASGTSSSQSATAQVSTNQTSMGTYEQVAGAIPPATSAAWFTWYNTLETARLDYSLQPRAQTFYFSSSGNDITGNGSEANPWQSLAQARNILTETGGNVALLFERGDEFDDTVGLNVTEPDVTIGAYGDPSLPDPVFSAFTIKYAANTNVWTSVSGTSAWSTSAPNLIGWIRDATNAVTQLSPDTYLQSASAVESTARSWTWSNGTLYLNPGTSVNPNTINWEAVGNVDQDGIDMSGDGGLITNIRTDGWGCVATEAYEAWGIVLSPENNASVVCMNCASFYNGIHAIGTMAPPTDPTASGGFSLLLNNVAGYTDATSMQNTEFIFFSPSGGNEVLSQGNTVEFGQLPDFNLIGGGLDTSNPAYFGHTGDQPGQTVSLVISMDDRVVQEYYQGATYSSGINDFDSKALPGENSNLMSLRRFIVDYQVLNNTPYTVSASINTVQINCLYQINGILPSSGVLDNNGGWFINCIWDITDPEAAERYFFNAYSAIPTLYLLYNSFLLNGTATTSYQTWDIVDNSGNNNHSVFAADSVFAAIGTRSINLNMVNSSQNLLSNAYYNVNNPSSYNGDPYSTILSSAPNLLSAPSADSQLIGAAEPTTFGYTVDYDFYGHLRNLSAPTLGAIEFNWHTLPTTDAGQYYIVQAGQSLVLDAKNPQADASYSWEINGDSTPIAVGSNPIITWNQLQAFGITAGSNSVILQTTIGSTVTYSAPAYLEVVNRSPSLSITITAPSTEYTGKSYTGACQFSNISRGSIHHRRYSFIHLLLGKQSQRSTDRCSY